MENVHPAIIAYNQCAMMEWHHLPRNGGIGRQDPEMLERWATIRKKQHEHDERKRKQEEARRKRGGPVKRR